VIDSTLQVDRILNGAPWTIMDMHFIILAVCKITKVRQSDIMAKNSGDGHVIRARQLVHYFARFRTNLTLMKIGEATGGFDYSTVIYSCSNIQKLYEFDKETRLFVDKIENELINTFKR
jgi:chromosomal replication initiator protein